MPTVPSGPFNLPAPLATLADVEARAMRNLTTAEEAFAQAAIDAISGKVRRYTRNSFSGSIPAEITDLVASAALRRLSNPEDVRQFSIGSFSATFAAENISATGWSPEERLVLDAYMVGVRSRGTVQMVTTELNPTTGEPW